MSLSARLEAEIFSKRLIIFRNGFDESEMISRGELIELIDVIDHRRRSNVKFFFFK